VTEQDTEQLRREMAELAKQQAREKAELAKQQAREKAELARSQAQQKPAVPIAVGVGVALVGLWLLRRRRRS
jgi:uncharacterized protein (TIGR03382 family)